MESNTTHNLLGTEYFVTAGIAEKLKVLKFDKPTMAYFDSDEQSGQLWQVAPPVSLDNNSMFGLFYPNMGDNVKFCAAPVFDQAFDWIRENYGIQVSIIPTKNKRWNIQYYFFFDSNDYDGIERLYESISRELQSGNFNIHREAQIDCLDFLLNKIIENDFLSHPNFNNN